MVFLRCFWLAFENSLENRQIYEPIEKIRLFKIKYANKRKSSTKRFFSMHSKPIFLERNQEAGLLRRILIAFDNSKS